MSENGKILDRRDRFARSFVSGQLDPHNRERAERDLAFDPEFRARVASLALSLRQMPPAAAPRHPVVVDARWMQSTQALRQLTRRRFPFGLPPRAANDRRPRREHFSARLARFAGIAVVAAGAGTLLLMQGTESVAQLAATLLP